MHISKAEFRSLLLCNLFALANLSNRCSPEYCNYAGDCSLVDGKPNCKCYEESFYGNYCEQVKDLCKTDKNVCNGSQICVPYVGQTICDCPLQRSGTGSDCDKIVPTKPLCSYNVRAVYGITEHMVLSFEDLGTEPLQITISTPTYMIAQVTRNQDEPRARTVQGQRTYNLTGKLQELGIRRHIRLPYNDAWYYVFPAKHYTLGANQLQVSIESLGRKPQLQTLSLTVHVVHPRNVFCMATIMFAHGMKYYDPRQVDVEFYSNIQASIEHRCFPENDRFSIIWSIYNYGENFAFYTKSIGDQLLFKIPPYSLWYHQLLPEYPHLLLTVHFKLRENNGPWVAARCYINVTARNVIAHLKGGNYREVRQKSKWLELDGSASREPATPYRTKQNLLYSWTLNSEDGNDTENLSIDNPNSILRIPTNRLKIGTKNIITLTVANDQAKIRKDSTSQAIWLVSEPQSISVEIECIRNCLENEYSKDNTLHMSASCENCNIPTNYIWTLNGVDKQQNKVRLVTRLADQHGELHIQLNVTNAYGKGYNEIRLHPSVAPSGGSCRISPRAGLACVDKFRIRCDNYSLPIAQPLLYTFKLGSILQEISYSGRTHLYLNGKENLTVLICGLNYPCTTVTILCSVRPIQLPGTETVRKLLIEGRRQQAFCLLHLLSDSNNTNDVLDYFKAIELDRTFTLMEMINTLEFAQIVIEALPFLDNFEAYVISHILERVKFTFDFIRKDGEIYDLFASSCMHLGRLITNIVANCMIMNKELMKQTFILWEFDGPFKEDYVDWPRFKKDLTPRISRFLNLVNLIFYIWQVIGEESTAFILPEEPFEHVSKGVSYRLQMHETYDPIFYTSNCTSCSLEVPLPSVEAQRRMLGSSELMLHTWCFDSNIFWWAPEAWSPNSAVLAVNIIAPITAAKVKSRTNQWYKLRLRRRDNPDIGLYEQSDEIHNNMIIYKVQLNGRLNMLINFVNSTVGLRVLITMNVEPTLNNLYDKNCYVPPGGRNRTMVLKNRCEGMGMAYIAVFKSNSFDTAPGSFKFRLSAQECLVWRTRDNDPHWVKDGCYPNNLEQSPEYLQCDNDHLSIFTAKEYVIQPFPINKVQVYVFEFPINALCVLFNCLMMLSAIGLLILGTMRLRRKKMNLIRVIRLDRDETDPRTENVIIHLRTGGVLLGKTTANIKLVFISDLGRYKVVIYQNPIDPHLALNTSCMLRVSDRKVQLPCELTISHDVAGRYPTWYCRAIQVDDLRRDLSYTFPIHSWLKRAQRIRVSCMTKEKHMHRTQLHQVEVVKGWKKYLIRFRFYSKFYYTNWFMMQPILGPWRFTDESCNIYERTCIWICKTVLTITIVFCFYRTTSYLNYYQYEQNLTLMDFSQFLPIAIGSYLVVLAFEYGLHHLTYI